jgi:hypothetical protein
LKSIDRCNFHCIERRNTAALLYQANLSRIWSDDANIRSSYVSAAARQELVHDTYDHINFSRICIAGLLADLKKT